MNSKDKLNHLRQLLRCITVWNMCSLQLLLIGRITKVVHFFVWTLSCLRLIRGWFLIGTEIYLHTPTRVFLRSWLCNSSYTPSVFFSCATVWPERSFLPLWGTVVCLLNLPAMFMPIKTVPLATSFRHPGYLFFYSGLFRVTSSVLSSGGLTLS